ncbi:MAG TPA: fumarate hydratase [Firmicutes bacterium]|nr:fumarate hydratase [Bacillota bacterium]
MEEFRVTNEEVEWAAAETFKRAITQVPPDVLRSLELAVAEETEPIAKQCLQMMLRNAEEAQHNRVICQDTGIPVFIIEAGPGVTFDSGLRSAFERGVERVSREMDLRQMAVHPLTRKEYGYNIGRGVPIIHFRMKEGFPLVRITAIPKGAGSGTWGRVAFLQPLEGIAGVKRFVLESVVTAGSNPCPPTIIGIGIGGDLEEVALMATLASCRPIGSRHEEDDIAALEDEILKLVNEVGIGPMGLGGKTTALAVNIEYAFTHKPWLPVALNIQCWTGRRATALLFPGGRREIV